LGTLKITNHYRYSGGIYSGVSTNPSDHKIVIRIPKIDNPVTDKDYTYLSLAMDETLSFNFLKEGFYNYAVKPFKEGCDNGWCWNWSEVATGNIQIKKCKMTEITIK
jgi:hypothetical protein